MAYGHQKDDIRIAQKECASLIKSGYDVYYATFDRDNNREVPDGIHYIPIHESNESILVNYFVNKKLIKEYCSIIEEVKPELVHIHEYGISFLVKLIKKRYPQIRVIYDVHEDNIHEDYEGSVKKYGRIFAKLQVLLRAKKEHEAWKLADYNITVTPHIRETIEKVSEKVEIVRNYPIISPQNIGAQKNERLNIICYAGGLSPNRNVEKLIRVAEKTEGILILAGPVEEDYLEGLKKKYGNSYQAKWFYKGFLKKEEVNILYQKSKVGVLLYKKMKNHVEALPNKLFEYMEAELPVVLNDFPLWENIVKETMCGYCVDERDEDAICAKIDYLFTHPKETQQMGQNGRRAVLEKYNWSIEEKKLLQIYKELI